MTTETMAPPVYRVRLSVDEDGRHVAVCSDIEGCAVDGATREEALANIREVIAVCLEADDPSRGEVAPESVAIDAA